MYTPIILIFIFLLMILFMSFRNKWIIKDNINTTGCSVTEFGCCPDNLTPKLSPNGENCISYHPVIPPPPPPPPQPVGGCSGTQYGCCPDGVTARDQYGTNCSTVPPPPPPPPPPQPVGGCSGTQYGCCPDGVTARDQYGTNCPGSKMETVSSLIKDSVYQHCMDTIYKCCSDGKTPKQDANGTNCPV